MQILMPATEVSHDMSDRRKLIAAVTLLTGGAVAVYLTGYLDPLIRLFGDPEYIREIAEPYGVFGVFILLGLQLLNIIFAPIPGQGIGIAYGLMYGVFWGTLFGMIGTTIGTAIAVLVSKWYGRPAVKTLIGEERFRRYESITESVDVYPFVILIILPVIPDDAIAYLAGLSAVKTRRLIIWLAAARFPGMLALTWFGDGLATADYVLMGGIVVVVTVVSIWVIWKRNWIIDTLSQEKPTEE